MQHKGKVLVITVTATSAMLSLPASAGPNDFFGTTVPGSPTAQMANPQAAPAQAPNPYDQQASKGDFTDDEKRMQKKYKSKVKHAEGLIAKGTKMMRGKDPKSKSYKKGKIFKDIGERELAELKANNPLANLLPEENAKENAKKAKKKKSDVN